MTIDIAQQRLYHHYLGPRAFERPEQAIAWFGAMQAQDYNSVKWAIGLRCSATTDESIELAFAHKTIIRTWLLRGTLQVVAPADVAWMLAVVAPRIIKRSARRYQQLDLDEPTFIRSFNILTKVLQGGRPVTRAAIFGELEQAGVVTAGQRGYHILRRAGLEGLICFGPMIENHETFVLLSEWVPDRVKRSRDEALGELAKRYFNSHGPTTLPDFVWWSGLLKGEARKSLDLAKADLESSNLGDETYWQSPPVSAQEISKPTAHLLPAYDEYYLGYTTREAVLNPNFDARLVSSSGVFRPMIVVNGQIVGIWQAKRQRSSILIIPSYFRVLSKAEQNAVAAALDRYRQFLGVPLHWSENL